MGFIPQENVVLMREWLRKEENTGSVVSHHPLLGSSVVTPDPEGPLDAREGREHLKQGWPWGSSRE